MQSYDRETNNEQHHRRTEWQKTGQILTIVNSFAFKDEKIIDGKIWKIEMIFMRILWDFCL